MFRSLWPAAPVVAVIALAALALGADQPVATLFFSALLSLIAVLALVLPGAARTSGLGAAWLAGGCLLYLIGLIKGWVSTGAAEYAALMAGGGVFLLASDAALKRERAELLITLVICMGALLGLAGFVDFFLAPSTVFGFERRYHVTRLSAPFLSANTAATFYGMIALLTLAALLRALKRGGRADKRIQRLALPAAALLICASCLFLTGSRAGATLFMISALLLMVWDRAAAWRARLRRSEDTAATSLKPAMWRTFAGPGVLLILGIIVFGISGGLFADRVAQDGLFLGDDARGVMFARYLQGVWLYPVLGSGLGGFEFINDFLAQAGDAQLMTSQNAAHNLAFQWILQTGFTGVLAALALTIALLLRIRKGLSRRRSQTLILRATLVIALFVFAHGMVDYALEIPAVFWLFSLILGLGVGVSEGGSSSPKRRPAETPARIGVIAILAITAGLSVYAGLDRLSVRTIADMSDETFLAQAADEAALTGSAARLEAIGDRALRLQQPDLALARTAFVKGLSREPRNGKLWAKLAYANYALIPVMAGESEEALRQSYYLMPYADADFRRWRLAFITQCWSGLPEDIKAMAEREARILPGSEAERWRRQVGISRPSP